MVQITVFSGHEGRLGSNKKLYRTIMGGCTLVRPTIARQIIATWDARRDGRINRPGPFFLTIFGGLDIKCPTLAEEFVDLRDMLNSSTLRLEDWDKDAALVGLSDATTASFTLFGGFDENKLPSENEEVDSLAIQRHIGNISEESGNILQLAIGRSEAERRAAVRRAVLAAR